MLEILLGHPGLFCSNSARYPKNFPALRALLCNTANFKVCDVISCECISANARDITLIAKYFPFVLYLVFYFFFQLLCISLVLLIFPYSAPILLENALLCRQNAHLKNRLLCSKFCRQNLSKLSDQKSWVPVTLVTTTCPKKN